MPETKHLPSRLGPRVREGEYVTLVVRTAEPEDDFRYTASLIMAPGHEPVRWTITENPLDAEQAALERANRELAELGLEGLTVTDWKPTGYLVYQAAVPGWPRADVRLPPLLRFPTVPAKLPGYLRGHIEQVKKFVDSVTADRPRGVEPTGLAVAETMIAQHVGIDYVDLADVDRYVAANTAALLAACDSAE